jgi:hypothetical protein
MIGQYAPLPANGSQKEQKMDRMQARMADQLVDEEDGQLVDKRGTFVRYFDAYT